MSFLSDYDQPGGLPRVSRQTTVDRVKETMPPWAGCLVQLVNLRERVLDNGLVSKLFQRLDLYLPYPIACNVHKIGWVSILLCRSLN